jgi:hypothetical protein
MRVWNSHLPQEIRDEVVKLHKEGHLIRQIEAISGLSYHQVRKCIENPNGIVHRVRKSKFNFDACDIADIIRRATVGLESAATIAKQYNCSKGHICNLLRKADVDLDFWCNQKKSKSLSGRSPKNQKPKRLIPQEQVDTWVHLFTRDLKSTLDIASMFNVRQSLVSSTLKQAGINVGQIALRRSVETRKKKGYFPSPKCGFGIKTEYTTPFQGTVTMRSRTEAARAKELDEEGFVWFYEVAPFRLKESTYLPDFWVTKIPIHDARSSLGSYPGKSEIESFIAEHGCVLEDVKGWFNEKSSSFKKIKEFRGLFPDLLRVLVLNPRTGERHWA